MKKYISERNFKYEYAIDAEILGGVGYGAKCPYCGHYCIYIPPGNVNGDSCIHFKRITHNGIGGRVYFEAFQATIFKHSDIQSFIFNLPKGKQRNRMLERLNSVNVVDVIAVEWEIAILAWLSTFGTIEYEKPNVKGRKPDVTWENVHHQIRVVADITSVSDEAHRKSYPNYEFLRGVSRLIREILGDEYSANMTLKSSSETNFEMFPKSRITTNLDKVKEHLYLIKEPHDFEGRAFEIPVEENKLVIHILRNSAYNFSSPGVRHYLHNDLSDPITNALKDKAEKQLMESDSHLVAAFVCDGDCQLLNDFRSPSEKQLDEIVSRMFEDYPHIDFIAFVHIAKEIGLPFGFKDPPKIDIKFALNPTSGKKEMQSRFYDLCKLNFSRFLQPQYRPYESRQRIKEAICTNERIHFSAN